MLGYVHQGAAHVPGLHPPGEDTLGSGRPEGFEGEGRMVRATILTDFVKEKARFGIAIDGSRSMRRFFETDHRVWPSSRDQTINEITTVIQKLGAFLAQRDSCQRVSLFYWASGTGHESEQ